MLNARKAVTEKNWVHIEKYYNVTEHKEEVLKRISDFLFQMTFPTGKIAYTRYDL